MKKRSSYNKKHQELVYHFNQRNEFADFAFLSSGSSDASIITVACCAIGRTDGLTGRARPSSIIQSSYLHQRAASSAPPARETISPIGLLYFGPRRKLFRAAALNLSRRCLGTSSETSECHLTGDFRLAIDARSGHRPPRPPPPPPPPYPRCVSADERTMVKKIDKETLRERTYPADDREETRIDNVEEYLLPVACSPLVAGNRH
ncbi:hypothetical protein PUN28_014976 [Cardiocondyla obscurior]|uniref:Uncharacterized protein n=1 Tax=Cardiocondyla obscurior TaxID=286306 RepID=A0AAW2F1M8_9HYME